MRRAPLVLLGIVLVASLLAVGFLAAARGTVAEPARTCRPGGDLVVEFGAIHEWEGVRSVAVYVKNAGEEARTVLVGSWEVDLYRVRWDGRLATSGSQRTEVDHVEGYSGERLGPGERHGIGHVQVPREASGTLLLLAWAGEACGRSQVRA